MSYEVKGKLKVKFDTQTFSSGFQKREFIVTTNETYPQDIKLELVKDKCSLIDKFNIGQSVNVFFNLRGSEYNGKYYVSLAAWKIEQGDVNVKGNPAQPFPSQPQPTDLDDQDLPF